ncbi:MAG: hypothetical protein IH831_03035 [Planctomycetes bacterium]|nr:hypothetical protein [Planctomycetota bacterium]
MNVRLAWFRPFAALLLLALTGCGDVTTNELLGTRSNDEPLNSLAVDGVWVVRDEPYFLKRVNESELRIAGVEWKDDHFHLREWTIILTTDQDVPYVNVVNPESLQEKPEYWFLRVLSADDSEVVLIPAKTSTFEAAVKEGRIAGTIKKEGHSTTVHLQATKEEQDAFVDPHEAADQFDITSPLVFRRLSFTVDE